MTRHQLGSVGLHCLLLSGCCPVKLVLDPASSLGLEQAGRRLDSGLKLTSPSPKEPLPNSSLALYPYSLWVPSPITTVSVRSFWSSIRNNIQ